MDISTNEIKDIAIIAKPFIDPIITSLIAPKIKLLEKWLKAKNLREETVNNFFENKFKVYLENAYRNFSSVNILVFPNQQIDIKSIYMPTTLSNPKWHEDTTITKHEANFLLKQYERVLVSDTAGMGKSTLMKWIGLSMIETGITIPVLIDLKNLSKENKILDEIYKQIDDLENSFNKSIVIKFLELGNFTILLDGFDEIKDENLPIVISDLKSFTNKLYKNWFILTSRPVSSLTSFGNFKQFHIKELVEADSYSLFRKYDAICKSNISEKLIIDLNSKDTQAKEFLGNPFLASLLYKTYTYSKNIPTKKSSFYDEIYGALYKDHDLSKDGYERDKKSKLDILDFRKVLRLLAFNSLKETKIIYTEKELINSLTEVNNQLIGINFNENDFIEDLCLTVPLFIKEGFMYKWAHRSIQEYFAADYISSSNLKSQLINKLYVLAKSNYLNVVDFLFDLEPSTIRQELIKPILDKFIFFHENSYQDYPLNEKDINTRKAHAFLSNFKLLQTTYDENQQQHARKFLDLQEKYDSLEKNNFKGLDQDLNKKMREYVMEKNSHILPLEQDKQLNSFFKLADSKKDFYGSYIITVSIMTKGSLCFFVTYTYDLPLLQLLANRDNSIFESKQLLYSNDDNFDFVDGHIELGKIYELDDNKSSIFNQTRFFNLTTQALGRDTIIISSDDPNQCLQLSYKKVKQAVMKINKDILNNNSNDILDKL